MENNFEKTKDFDLDELVPDGVTKPKTNEQEEITVQKDINKSKRTQKNGNQKPKGKQNKQFKFKPIYLVPITFVLIIIIFVGWMILSSRENGPVYGDRCSGLLPLEQNVLQETTDEIKNNNEKITELAIEKNCRSINVDFTLTAESSADDAKAISKSIIESIDKKAGAVKTNENSAYTDIFGVTDIDTENERNQYDVNFIIQVSDDKEDDAFPIFASKHPGSDDIQFTLNTPRDEDVVKEVLDRQEEKNNADQQ